MKILLIILAFLSSPSWAKDDFNFSYPELLVAPSASDRVVDEAKSRPTNFFKSPHLSIAASGFTTFVAGIFQLSNNKNENNELGQPERPIGPGLTGIGIGAAWMGIAYYMHSQYHPYYTGAVKLKKMTAKSTKDQLAKERYAEEVLFDAKSLARKIVWLSAASNFSVSIYMMARAESDSISTGLNLAAIIASFAPIYFGHDWITTANRHKENKKKIYGPISYVPFMMHHKESNTIVPGYGVSFSF
ncbi:MAG: hypothetical protein H6622_15810 [Halobacteriovoraceae bacterium]|nr:hypothetical protein [Halobacteriovoraceae bacterium]